MKYWLFKTEPEVFSIENLADAPQQTVCWEGVRNYQARNMLRDEMRVRDRVLIYHSGGLSPVVVGTARITQSGYPDHHAWNSSSKYFDPGSTEANPRWYMVNVTFETIFRQPISLAELREIPELAEMGLLRKGNRLSIQPVTKSEFAAIAKKGAQKEPNQP